MMKKLAIIHTTPATIEPLKALALEMVADCQVVNFMDDSILPQLAENGGDLRPVAGRLIRYARFAEQAGADAILEACSSVGPLAPMMQEQVSIPVVRIDEAMAEEAVHRGACIGIAATLETTLKPTAHLVRAKAREAGRRVEVKPVLVRGAYERLMAGDKEAHDALLVKALSRLANEADAVVLAQASMARVVPLLPTAEQSKFLSSPRSGMARVRDVLEHVANQRAEVNA